MTHCDIFKLINRFRRTKPVIYVKGQRLSGFDVGVLFALSKMSEDGMSEVKVSTLADMMHMKKPAFSKALGTIEDKGLISRRNSKTDRREVYVEMTPLGREFCSIAKVEVDEKFERFAQLMGEDDLDEFFRVLAKAVIIWEKIND